MTAGRAAGKGTKLPCPTCQSREIRTLKTRFVPTRMATWRRLKCQACGHAFSTFERLVGMAYSPKTIQAAQQFTAVKHARKRAKAHKAVFKAVRKGQLVQPNVCSGCGNEIFVEAHHPNYNKPLSVVWLCKPCHDREHQ